MIKAEKAGFVPVAVLVMLTALAGCKNDGTQTVDAAAANGNLAPVSDNGNAASVNDSVAPAYPAAAPQSAPAYPAPSQQHYPQQAQQAQYPAPQPQQYSQPVQQPQYQDQSQDINDQDYQDVDQVADYAPQPPPPLPEYQQPPCPEPNYIWTPGYWSYAPAGYYWVPGVWAAAPYVGALWTPGYWGYDRDRYGWHRGYWGRYIGYYGGVNYGNGYVGRGYYGGYWNHNQFDYNRRVTNVNNTVIHNTYITNVTNITTYNRVSYSGGRGGVNLPPSAAELAALRQPRLPELRVQQQNRVVASTNRAQFVAENRGRPQTVVMARPLPVERREPVPVGTLQQRPLPRPVNQPELHPGQGMRPQPPARVAQQVPQPRPAAPAPPQAMRPTQPERPVQQVRPAPQERPAPQVHPEPQPRPRAAGEAGTAGTAATAAAPGPATTTDARTAACAASQAGTTAAAGAKAGGASSRTTSRAALTFDVCPCNRSKGRRLARPEHVGYHRPRLTVLESRTGPEAPEGTRRVPHVRPSVRPDFLSNFMALAHFMRLSLYRHTQTRAGNPDTWDENKSESQS